MRLSLIINTCAGDPLAGQPVHGNRSYRQRYALLQTEILPIALSQGWDEVIVAGQFEEGLGYSYAEQQPIFRDRRDALWQRELGARMSTGHILAFSHDDHVFGDGIVKRLHELCTHDDWDLLVPRREDRNGVLLNNGKASDYMGGHSLVMRRWLWAQVPWTSVDTEWWDTTMTRIWREEGGRIVWDDSISHIDMDCYA